MYIYPLRVPFVAAAVLAASVLVGLPSLALAQASRTWVSGVGNDANPCSRTAPCKTFAGAISKTATNGEINAIDSGGFGAVTITKSITLDGTGVHASILASLVNGIIVNAPNATVILRNLSINGFANGINGIRVIAAKSVSIENCTISRFTGSGVDVLPTTDATVSISNTTIEEVTHGVKVANAPAGRVHVSIERGILRRSTNGINTLGEMVTVSNSLITQNVANGVLAESGTVTLDNVSLTNNGTAVNAQPGATIRLSSAAMFDNLTGIGCGGGTVATAGDNIKGGNTGGGAACTPNASINLQ